MASLVLSGPDDAVIFYDVDGYLTILRWWMARLENLRRRKERSSDNNVEATAPAKGEGEREGEVGEEIAKGPAGGRSRAAMMAASAPSSPALFCRPGLLADMAESPQRMSLAVMASPVSPRW